MTPPSPPDEQHVTEAHAPTPWVADGFDFYQVMGSSRNPLGNVYGPSFAERGEVGRRALANAAFIVRAVNAHDELVNALEILLLNYGAALALCGGQDQRSMEIARTAIARAKGAA